MPSYRANAKINLLLDVTGKRADGYHDVIMLLQSVTLHDVVTVERSPRPGIEILCDQPGVPANERNTMHRAARAFGVTDGLRITLQKNIPHEAGLGGGSADAAAVLTALRTLFRPAMPESALLAIGAQVGADVPFCLAGGCCLAQGIGERLEALPCLPPRYHIAIAKPRGFHVRTPEAYQALDGVALKHPDTAQAIALARQGAWERVFPLCANVFEQVVQPPGLAQAKRGGALLTQLTGSGSAVFSIDQAGAHSGTLAAVDPQIHNCRAAAQGVAQLQ